MLIKFTMFVVTLTACLPASSQSLLKVYHGERGESKVFDNSNGVVVKPKLKMSQDDILTVEVINANTLLYSYSLKFEKVNIESEDKAITDLLATFNTIIAARAGAFTGTAAATDDYKKAINLLITDINTAKKIIIDSDSPELQEDALQLRHTKGLRKALDDLKALPTAQYRFNNTNLLNDLNTLSDKAKLDDVEKQAFKILNSSLVEKVNEIKKQTKSYTIETEWKNEFKVTESSTKITLAITKIDKTNNLLTRDGIDEKGFQLELGTIIPYYKRATLEIVPVANFIFSNNVREFYIENSLVQNRSISKTTTNAGVILNINIARFGPTKEMSVGVGPGYKFNSNGNAFEHFYLSTLLSYKNYIRIGLGLGLAQFPTEELQSGVKVGEPLPANISNLNDLLNFREKPSAFLTIAFTGLNLGKRK
jgi:hypothetical protein